MRTLLSLALFLSLSFASSACNNNEFSHRSSYVISKSHDTTAEIEVMESPDEE